MSPPSFAASSSGAGDARAWISAWRAKSGAKPGMNIASSAPRSAAALPGALPADLPALAAGAGALAAEYAPKLALVAALAAGEAGAKALAAAAGTTFPPALLGMAGLLAALTALSSTSPATADALQAAAAPGLDWVSRWLPLFYVPSLVVLPLAVRGIPAPDLARMLAIIAAGMPATLLATAALVVAIRRLVNTPAGPPPPSAPPKPFTTRHYVGWGAVGVVSLVAAGTGAGPPGQAASAFMLAATVLGYLGGVSLPARVRVVAHPVIVCAAAANAGAALLGALTGAGYEAVLGSYLTKGVGGAAWGAGDGLMALLGVVILSYAFRIHAQRGLVKRHAAEIGGAAVGSAAFSMFATAAVARAVGLGPDLARALVPRSVTVALALPIAATLGAPASIAAAGVVLTGLLGANFAQALLTAAGYTDPIARGLATAGAAHGLGTAALARSEPEALPFCALGYALIGVAASVLAALPPVTAALLALTG